MRRIDGLRRMAEMLQNPLDDCGFLDAGDDAQAAGNGHIPSTYQTQPLTTIRLLESSDVMREICVNWLCIVMHGDANWATNVPVAMHSDLVHAMNARLDAIIAA
jgi:hypothetical protein